jgi:hypothetical protein
MTDIHLPYVTGVPVPAAPSGPAVGFSTSSTETQTAGSDRFGKTFKKLIPIAFTPIIVDTFKGEARIILLGGAACWVGFADNFVETDAYKLVAGQDFSISPVVPVWGYAQQLPEVSPTLVQVLIVADRT